jgi:hypothetical protein
VSADTSEREALLAAIEVLRDTLERAQQRPNRKQRRAAARRRRKADE